MCVWRFGDQELSKVVPPPRAQQVAAAAARESRAPVALYLLDVEGEVLRRVAGTDLALQEISANGAIGPELPPVALRALRARGGMLAGRDR